MTDADILKIIGDIVFEVTGISTLTLDTDFVQDLALNSLDVANMVAAFEEHFHIRIPAVDVWKLTQIKDVVEYLREKL